MQGSIAFEVYLGCLKSSFPILGEKKNRIENQM